MVRHSGFLTSFAAVLLAAFSVSVLERRSDGSSQFSQEASVGTVVLGPGFDRALGNDFRDVGDLTQRDMSHPDTTIRFRVPKNSLVIVGSLDVSSAAHSLLISSGIDDKGIVDSTENSPDFGDLEYIDTASLSELQGTFPKPQPCQPDHVTSDVSKRTDDSIVAHSINGEPTRRFLIPHFELDQVVQQPSEALPLAQGSRVKVYMDLRIADGKSATSHQHQLCAEAQRVCTIIELELLPLVERWVGRISDLDADQHLSIVLTDLDRRAISGDTPILGCVRRGDFAAEDQNSLAGDIVYLNRHLPPPDQLRALLAHELTHAAIYCIRHEAPKDSPLKNHSVPSWLNEAAAHWVEQQFCRTPSGYAIREAAFRQCPAMCPIMLKDDDHHHPARRSGSRVAGFTFLQKHLADVRDLRQLLEQCTPFEQSISAVTRAPFSTLFRQWSISQAVGDHEECSEWESTISYCSLKTTDSDPVRRKLHGTAFLTLYSEADQSISIEADGDAQLQVTVLHQVNSMNAQHSTVISTRASLQTADLKSQTQRTIR